MICGGCNVRGVWEHRCHGRSRCKCTECWCSCGEERPCQTHDAVTDPATKKAPDYRQLAYTVKTMVNSGHVENAVNALESLAGKTPLLLFHAWLERPPWNVTDHFTILATTREQAFEILRKEVSVTARTRAKFEDYKMDEGEDLEAGVVSQQWNGDRH